jgi:hypothetical protein
MRSLALSFFVATLLFSCQPKASQPYFPPQNEELTDAEYQQFTMLLDSAYAQNNLFSAGFQLANLKAPPEKVFALVDAGVQQNVGHCVNVFDWYQLYKNDNFRMNLVKADTARFEATFQLCLELLGENAYADHLAAYEKEVAAIQARKAQQDSSRFDYQLIKELMAINEDDQRNRKALYEPNISEQKKTALWEKQKRLDSINLVKIARILENGYPSRALVGYEHFKTPWLILHHQGDPEIRDRFRPVLEQAVADGILGEGMLEAFKMRDEHIRMEQE